jgi:hypothetical protein
VRNALRTIGILGAVFLLAGSSLLGASMLTTDVALGNLYHCRSDCLSDFYAEQNASVLSSFLSAFAFLSVGVGAGLVFGAAVVFMDRMPPKPAEERARPGSSPLPPPGGP